MSNIQKYKELKANLLEHKRFGVKPEQSLIKEFNKLSKETLKERTEKKTIKENEEINAKDLPKNILDAYKKVISLGKINKVIKNSDSSYSIFINRPSFTHLDKSFIKKISMIDEIESLNFDKGYVLIVFK